MTVLAVFRSRAQTIDFVTRLQRNGVAAQAVNTPKEAGVGCGLSAKFDGYALPQARVMLKHGNYSAFVGFFTWKSNYGRSYFAPMQC